MDLSFWLSCSIKSDSVLSFQSLLWWICLFDAKRASECWCCNGFQSLLWWICLFDKNSHVFYCPICKFQSLLWWICLFDDNYHGHHVNILLCFNPCYDGFVFLTYLNCVGCILIFWFQSLLWWICLFDNVSDPDNTAAFAVSILVMMDLSFWLSSLYCLNL